MGEISHREIKDHLENCREKKQFPGIYLIHGEPYLCQRAANAIVNQLLPDPDCRQLSLETMDSSEGQSASEAVETAATFSFFSGPRVVVYKTDAFGQSASGTKSQNKNQDTDNTSILHSAIIRGLPAKNHLILITEKADKRKRIYKAIAESGTIIDCAVPTGIRKADQNQQLQVLRQLASETLAPHKKNLDQAAFEHIFSLTGFDPRNFVNSLEKLILYTADRPRITAADASEVLAKTKDDPVYLFTGALAEKNLDLALHYLDSLLTSGYHPMQILSALISHVRRLIAAKSFVEDTETGRQWKSAMGFDRFKNNVLPEVIKYDEKICRYAETIKGAMGIQPDTEKDKTPTDMIIVKNPKNPYPVYQTFIQSDRFSGPELGRVIKALHTADLEMKTTGRLPKAVIEAMIFEVFAPMPDKISGKNQTQKTC